VGAAAVLRSRQLGQGAFTLGTLFMLMSYVWQLAGPITRLGGLAGRYGRIQAAAERLGDLLDEPEMPPEPRRADRTEAAEGSLAFQGVSFGYDPDRPVIRDLAFTIAPGEVVGLAGPSGAGKTTVAGLVCGFYPPDSGRVLVAGEPAGTGAAGSRIALVSPSPHLFQGSIRDNLVYGRPEATDEEIRPVLELVEADRFVERLPRGLDTPVGEGADVLSAGQKQRLALARGILAGRPILILDEATSGIDLWSERRIWRRLRERLQGTTILVITHRLHLMRHTDRVLVLVDGRLQEEGPHRELAARGGYYASCLELEDLDGRSPQTPEGAVS